MIDIHKNCCEYSIFDNDLAVNEPPILTRSSIPGMEIGLCKKNITHTDLLVVASLASRGCILEGIW